MAENHKLRQQATQDLFEANKANLAALRHEDRELLTLVARGFENELDKQGVPLYAEEAFAVLALIESLEADTASLEDIQESLEAMRLAMIQKISSAWVAKDKGFFIN